MAMTSAPATGLPPDLTVPLIAPTTRFVSIGKSSMVAVVVSPCFTFTGSGGTATAGRIVALGTDLQLVVTYWQV